MAPVAWMAVFSDAPVLSFLNFLESHDDFHRYFNRCLMLLALVGLGLLWRVTKIKSWAELGWTDFPKAKNHISIGLLIGLASLMAIAALGLIFEAREFRPAHPLGEWGKHWLNTLGAAIAVGVLEETLFRGMLFGLLRRDMNWRWAAVASALLFASVHFIDQRPNISEITWSTGFTAFPQFIHDFAHRPSLASLRGEPVPGRADFGGRLSTNRQPLHRHRHPCRLDYRTENEQLHQLSREHPCVLGRQ